MGSVIVLFALSLMIGSALGRFSLRGIALSSLALGVLAAVVTGDQHGGGHDHRRQRSNRRCDHPRRQHALCCQLQRRQWSWIATLMLNRVFGAHHHGFEVG
jgi:hypothetical protein